MNDIALSIVIPVFNETENIQELLERCLAACDKTNRPFEIVLVDDGSMDGSTEKLRRFAKREEPVVSVFLNRNYGQHAAVFAGFEQARGQTLITLDADLQNPPEEIPNLVREMDKGYDVVGTVRKNRKDSLFRRLASSMVNSLVRRSTGVMMHDYGCMLRAYSRPIVDAMLKCSENSTFIPILANSFARNTTEIKVAHELRRQGESKYSFFKLISLQFDLLTAMSTFPLRLLSIVGTLIAASGVGFGFFLIIMRFARGADWAAEGVFSLFAVLFIFIGTQFIGLGMLGEYIGRIYKDVRGRPRYFVQEVSGFQTAQSVSGKQSVNENFHETGSLARDIENFTTPVNPEMENSYENSCSCLS
ncbi:MAG TPA: glycosyltransferase [Desulfobacterales bacterium]|nr:glycosyltransferase [Desulfobacterales bacterium]HIP38032.1 glycosyltransferase [Desulfocapsa sulfexigens]